ncbi:cytochrome c oxidase accessory protein CcoG [Psychrobacter sp. DM4]|uniref:cytochrome c oxidase accessory protein CcoG n=1 Tax=Psychrobacter sp. DM4 TaxID=3440637 RepID=UPI003F507ED1
MSASQPNRIPIKQIDLDATKQRVHTRFVTGFYQNIRVVTMYALLAAFLLLPWLRYDGRQAIWFDVPSQHYYIFGMTFLTQDFYFIAAFALIAAFTLFMVTVFAGRVWCGYACPQTIWTHLYQHIEKWVIGDRNKRIKFDKSAMGPTKAFKRSLVYLIWFVLSVVTAATFVSYVAGTNYVFGSWQMFGIIPFPDWPTWIWVSMFIFTFATYANAGYMREQMCIQICPYGRFQSVMFDKDTLIVSYDYERGEPRGARKKGTNPDDLGDCIECTMCVQVCPTGIDIRDGLQVACIQCAACVDACNEVMDKVGYPRGLIRYTTERQLAEKTPSRVLRPRLFAYLALLAILCGGLIFALTDRVPLEIDIRRDRNQLSSMNAQGMIENSYVVKLTNKTQDEHTYKITLAPQEGLSLQLRFNDVPLVAGESFDMSVSVYGDPAVVASGQTPITLNVISEDGQYSVSKDNVFTTQGQ